MAVTQSAVLGLPRAAARPRSRSPASEAWRRLRRNRLAMLGAALLVVIVGVAAATPWIAPYSYEKTNLSLAVE